ncbi:MAG: c-type cytochrome [Chitinophagaceae bacterium]
MKQSALVIAAFGLMILMSFSFTKDDPKYKNLKVLPKNITHDQLDSVMHHFTNSLGVKCNFCHVRTADGKEWNFPSDDNKHKLVARNMMKMTNKINDKYFDVTSRKSLDAKLMVTCYTCHRGGKEPQTIPPVKED